MRVFVTGGSGFIGGHVIEHLVGQSHQVLALARSAASEAAVSRFGARPVPGDLGTVDPRMLTGVDAVVHAAAYVKSYGPRAAFEEANVEGTRRVVAAVQAAGVRRLVHVGTEAMLFRGQDLLGVDETVPPPRKHRYLYSETKARAEELVLRAQAPGLVALSLRPRLVWGPRDAAVLPELTHAVKTGAFAWLDGGRQRTSTAYVGNLAHAVGLALERGDHGNAYFIADAEEHRMRDFLTALAATAGLVLPGRSIPGAVARPLASAVESLWAWAAPTRKPPMVAFSVAMLSRSVTVKTDRARAVLGYAPQVSFEEGLRRTAAKAATDG